MLFVWLFMLVQVELLSQLDGEVIVPFGMMSFWGPKGCRVCVKRYDVGISKISSLELKPSKQAAIRKIASQ